MCSVTMCASRQPATESSQAPPGGGISVSPGYNATFDNITLTGGDLWVQPEEQPSGWSRRWSRATSHRSATGTASRCRAETLYLLNSVITGNETGVAAQGGGKVFAFSTDFTGNTDSSADVSSNSTLSADDSTFNENGNGVRLFGNSVLDAGNSTFANNGNVGVAVVTGSHARTLRGTDREQWW